MKCSCSLTGAGNSKVMSLINVWAEKIKDTSNTLQVTLDEIKRIDLIVFAVIHFKYIYSI